MKVSQAMHKGVKWVSPDTTLAEIAKIMHKNDIGSVPIGENDRLVGMVTDRDIVCRGLAAGADPAKVTARSVMSKGITYCRDDEDVSDAVRIMEQKKIRRLPVLDGKKRMVGMLSLGDVSDTTDRQLIAEVFPAVSAHHH